MAVWSGGVWPQDDSIQHYIKHVEVTVRIERVREQKHDYALEVEKRACERLCAVYVRVYTG